MGSGSWDINSFRSYSYATKMASVDSTGTLDCSMSNQEMFKSKSISDALNPKGIIRECIDSEEHPNTIPVILGLDVTGSMGQAAVEVAKKLNVIMTKLYEQVSDIEFMIMGIGDLAYDSAPIQASQFESDIRIAEQLDKVFFEFGGGGNHYESYTAAWYFGLYNTKLDCWNRNKKGIIITMGDELPNPYLPKMPLEKTLGISLQSDVNTNDLYQDVIKKFDIYHLDVNHCNRYNESDIYNEWEELLGDHFTKSNLNSIADDIVNIILASTKKETDNSNVGEISW